MERCVARAVLRRPGKLASSDGDDRGFAIILATIKDGLWCLSVVCTLCALSALSLSHPQIETGIGSHMVMNHFAHSPAKYRVKRREIICFDKKVVLFNVKQIQYLRLLSFDALSSLNIKHMIYELLRMRSEYTQYNSVTLSHCQYIHRLLNGFLRDSLIQ